MVDALVLVLSEGKRRLMGVKDGVSETETRGSSRALGGRGDEGETPERERERGKGVDGRRVGGRRDGGKGGRVRVCRRSVVCLTKRGRNGERGREEESVGGKEGWRDEGREGG